MTANDSFQMALDRIILNALQVHVVTQRVKINDYKSAGCCSKGMGFLLTLGDAQHLCLPLNLLQPTFLSATLLKIW